MIKLPVFKKKKRSQMFMQQICASLNTEITVFKLKLGQKLEKFTRYSDASDNKLLMGV